MPSRINIANLDFDRIKADLQQFLEDQTNVNDYDYTGSAINTILDAFAYVTQYNAFNANLGINETFLDSAQLRPSVVSHAKLLGYLPGSTQPARAVVDVISNTGATTLPQGTRFQSRIGTATVPFVNEKTETSVIEDGTAIFKNVVLTQGTYVTDEYVYDRTSAETFELTNPNPVTSTLQVLVQNSETDSTTENFVYVKNLVDLNGESNIYFLNENRREHYEVSFGDGVIGKRPSNSNIVTLRYIAATVGQGNGARVFTPVDIDATVQPVSAAAGATEKEDMQSIKFNAPLTFVAQNRAVTPNDYKTLIEQNFTNIQAISVWGGEDNDPPDYGRVYISIAPKDKETLSAIDKTFIESQILKPKNIVSITPIFTDPSYTYIKLKIFFKYNPNITNLSAAGVGERIREAIRNYDSIELRKFDGVFRASQLLRAIDDAEASIINSTIRVTMTKRLVPELNVERKYEIPFGNSIFNGPQQVSVIKSTEFQYLSKVSVLQDAVMGSDRIIRIARSDQTTGADPSAPIGIVNVDTGVVTLNSFRPESIETANQDYIEVTAIPASDDLAPQRNELLQILVDQIEITGEVDTIATGGSFAGVGYRTTPKYDSD